MPRPLDRRAGFTLIELVLALSILALLAGAAAPSLGRAMQARAKRATRDELELLRRAAAEYYRDVGELPRALADLERDPARAGWCGPYLESLGVDAASGLSSAAVDAWSTPYRVAVRGSTLVLASAGLDRVFDRDDEGGALELSLDITPIRRERTLARLALLNRAVEQYNAAHLPAAPLPGDLDLLLGVLVRERLLPAAEPFARDEWGAPFAPDPPGSPVLALRSRHIGR